MMKGNTRGVNDPNPIRRSLLFFFQVTSKRRCQFIHKYDMYVSEYRVSRFLPLATAMKRRYAQGIIRTRGASLSWHHPDGQRPR